MTLLPRRPRRRRGAADRQRRADLQRARRAHRRQGHARGRSRQRPAQPAGGPGCLIPTPCIGGGRFGDRPARTTARASPSSNASSPAWCSPAFAAAIAGAVAQAVNSAARRGEDRRLAAAVGRRGLHPRRPDRPGPGRRRGAGRGRARRALLLRAGCLRGRAEPRPLPRHRHHLLAPRPTAARIRSTAYTELFDPAGSRTSRSELGGPAMRTLHLEPSPRLMYEKGGIHAGRVACCRRRWWR